MPNVIHNLPIADILSEIHRQVTLPTFWISDISTNFLTNQLTVTFYKMGRHSECYSRMVEKQLVITAGKLY